MQFFFVRLYLNLGINWYLCFATKIEVSAGKSSKKKLEV
jgi:hypothetical protein